MSENDNLTLHTDFYEINMMATYFEKHMENRHAVFEVFFRKLPFGNGYAVFAGLEHVIQYIQELNFSDDDIAYLQKVTDYPSEFLEYLRTFKFKGTFARLMKAI
jgi:nicotinate phosphoribosyltransferase